MAIAGAKGFGLVHGIVDSMWLKKQNATDEDYNNVCEGIEKELGFPINFEGHYRWIVFLNSRVDPKVMVLNRYYGVFEDGTLKVRGIDDTPETVRKCQADMLNVLSSNSSEFMTLIPQALRVMKSYVTMLRFGKVPVEELVTEKRLSKAPNEYKNLVSQAIAAKHLVKEGVDVHAGQKGRLFGLLNIFELTTGRETLVSFAFLAFVIQLYFVSETKFVRQFPSIPQNRQVSELPEELTQSNPSGVIAGQTPLLAYNFAEDTKEILAQYFQNIVFLVSFLDESFC